MKIVYRKFKDDVWKHVYNNYYQALRAHPKPVKIVPIFSYDKVFETKQVYQAIVTAYNRAYVKFENLIVVLERNEYVYYDEIEYSKIKLGEVNEKCIMNDLNLK